jgi:hypothetical protein
MRNLILAAFAAFVLIATIVPVGHAQTYGQSGNTTNSGQTTNTGGNNDGFMGGLGG